MSRYPALATIVLMLVAAGWLGIVVGFGYYVLYEGVIEPRLPTHSFAYTDLIEIWTGLALGLGGFVTLAAGETIKVLVDIEKNTRVTATAARVTAPGPSGVVREPTF